MTRSILNQLQDRWGSSVDSAIRDLLRDSNLDATLITMLGYQLGYVDEHDRPTVGVGGKRFRSLLCLLAAESAGGRWEDALSVAAAIELLHNFSLIHDDIEDDDPIRRHRPTVWKVWEKPRAINAGDAMFALAGSAILLGPYDIHTRLELAVRLQATALELTHGQHLDMTFESRCDVTPDEYMRMIELKSGALIAFSAWAGAVTSGNSGDRANALHVFGLQLGRAFQIQDDILGIWAPLRETGKQQGRDLQNFKKTLPVLLAAQRAQGRSAGVLRQYLSGTAGSPDEVIQALVESDAREHATVRLRGHLDGALAALNGARLFPAGREELAQLAQEITRQ